MLELYGPSQNNEETDACDLLERELHILPFQKETTIHLSNRFMHPIGQDAAGRQMVNLALLDLWQSFFGAQRKGLKYAEVVHISVLVVNGFLDNRPFSNVVT